MSTCKIIVCICVVPEFITLQVACFKRFLKESVDFCYIDDSKTEEISQHIKEECTRGGHEYFRSPPHKEGREDSSCRHADTLLYGLQNMQKVNSLGQTYKYIGIFDSDLFPVTPLSLDLALQEKDLICFKLHTFHMTYFWPGCCIWRTDVHSLENYRWDICVDEGVRCDTGGTTHFYNKNHMSNPLELIEYKFKDLPRTQWLFLLMKLPRSLLNFCVEDLVKADSQGIRWWSDIYSAPDNSFCFFHLRDVSNWQGLSGAYLQSKFNSFYWACRLVVDETYVNVTPTLDEMMHMHLTILGNNADHICEA